MKSAKSPLLFLKMQASNEIIWSEMHRTDQRTPRRLSLFNASHVSLSRNPATHRFLRFLASSRSSLNKIGDMRHNTSCKFVELLHPPCNAPGWQFLELLPQPFPQLTSKHASYRIIVFWTGRHIRLSTQAPLNSVANQNGGIWTYFVGA